MENGSSKTTDTTMNFLSEISLSTMLKSAQFALDGEHQYYN